MASALPSRVPSLLAPAQLRKIRRIYSHEFRNLKLSQGNRPSDRCKLLILEPRPAKRLSRSQVRDRRMEQGAEQFRGYRTPIEWPPVLRAGRTSLHSPWNDDDARA